MIPPFAVSFSSSLRTRTRSCRGVIFTVISLTSIQSIPKLEQLTFCGSRPALRAKTLLVLLLLCFEVADLLFLTFGLSLRFLLFLEFHGLGKGNFSFGIESFGINNKLKATGERRADKIEGIL